MGEQGKEFIGYEYKEVYTDSSKASFLLDGYENFGWKQDENIPQERWGGFSSAKAGGNPKKAVLYLKRNRKITNKMELTRLQRNFEACVADIEALERSQTSAATVCALILGILGTAFMAGSVFAVTAEPPRMILSILLAVPGFAGWMLPYFVYRLMERKQSRKTAPMLEQKYDEIYEICGKGNKLLN